MDVDEAINALHTALGEGDVKKLRRVVSELKGTEIPLTPVFRMYWVHYWKGRVAHDRYIQAIRPLFPQCGDSQFHPDLTLEDGLEAWNARLVCERIWAQMLTEEQIEGVLDLWREFLRTGHLLEGKELEETLLAKYPFLRREAVVEQMLEGLCPDDEQLKLSNGSRVALTVMKGKEIRYELS